MKRRKSIRTRGPPQESLDDSGWPAGSLTDLMGHGSIEITKSFYAILEQDDLRRKHDRFISNLEDWGGRRQSSQPGGKECQPWVRDPFSRFR
jgi:hypothetical protein